MIRNDVSTCRGQQGGQHAHTCLLELNKSGLMLTCCHMRSSASRASLVLEVI